MLAFKRSRLLRCEPYPQRDLFRDKQGRIGHPPGTKRRRQDHDPQEYHGNRSPKQGTILFDDVSLCGKKPHAIASLGVGYVPEERMIFPSLTVLENLSLPRGGPNGVFGVLKRFMSTFRF